MSLVNNPGGFDAPYIPYEYEQGIFLDTEDGIYTGSDDESDDEIFSETDDKCSKIFSPTVSPGKENSETSVPTRLSSLYKIPTSFINQTISTVKTVFAVAAHARFSLSGLEKLVRSALSNSEETEEKGDPHAANYMVSEPFLHFVKFINPNAKIEIKIDDTLNSYEKWIAGTIVNCRRSENLFKNHVVSRLVLSMFIVTATVQNIARAIFGAIAGTLAVLSLGLSERLNNWATWGLQVNVVADLSFNGILMYNPSIIYTATVDRQKA